MQAGVGAGMAGAEIRVEKPQNGPPSGKPVNIEIVGPDVDQLKVIAEQVTATLKNNPVFNRLEGLDNDMARGRPELVIEVDRERAALYELSTSQVGTTIRTAIQGAEAAKFRQGKDEYDIVVRLAEQYRNDLDALRDLTVMADGRQVPLLSVARWHVDEGLGTVKRKDLDRVATVSSDVRAGEQSNAVLAEVRRVLAPVVGGPAAGLHAALHRAAGGPDGVHALPRHGVHRGAAPDRLHPDVAVQLGAEAGDHHDVRGHVDGGRADWPDHLPHAVRHHHDRRGHHIAGGRRGEQRDRADRLHRPPARAGRDAAA
jgi:hypothetical protein